MRSCFVLDAVNILETSICLGARSKIMPSRRSYLDAVTRDPDITHDMVAPVPPGPPMINEHDGTNDDSPVALVNTYSTAHITDQSVHPNSPDKFWDGDRSTLLTFLSELENTLSTHDTSLHTFAIHYYAMLNNGKTVIAHPGQAAQLDGALARPLYTWGNPAPEDDASYGVGHVEVVTKHNELHAERRLANPNLPDDKHLALVTAKLGALANRPPLQL